MQKDKKKMITSKTSTELYDILKYMDKVTVMKIPIDILKQIKNNKDNNYISRVDKDDLFNESNVSKDTIDLLCYFYKHYWSK